MGHCIRRAVLLVGAVLVSSAVILALLRCRVSTTNPARRRGSTRSSSAPHPIRPARRDPPLRIWRPPPERQRNFNPPEYVAAQRTLRDFPMRPIAPSATGDHGLFRFSHEVHPSMHGIPDRAGLQRVLRERQMWPSAFLHSVGVPEGSLSRLYPSPLSTLRG